MQAEVVRQFEQASVEGRGMADARLIEEGQNAWRSTWAPGEDPQAHAEHALSPVSN